MDDDKEYEQSALGKRVNELMDDGYEFGEAVKEAMAQGYKDGGLMIAIQKLAQGGMTYGDKTYHQYHDQFLPPDIESMGYANGGGIGSMMVPKRQGLFMGGPPLTGEALNIYSSMNAYGYTDQEIADRLSGLNLYTPPGTTPPTTPPAPPGGGGGGGGGGDGGGGSGTTTTTKTRDKKIDKGIFDAEADKGSLTLEEITAMNDLSGQESMRGQIPTKTTSVLEEIISSDRPNMLDISGDSLPINFDTTDVGNPTGDSRIVSEEQGLVGTPLTFAEARRAMTQPGFTDKATVYDPYGIKVEDGRFSYDMNKTSVDDFKKGLDIPDRNRGMEVNENFIDRGNPTGDFRVVSEEMGLVGGIPDRNRGQITSTPTGGITTIDRPNMADIAGPIGFRGAPIDMQVTNINGRPVDENDIEGIVRTLPAPPDIFSGYAQDPEGVEDPFDGKYTPSFEEKKAAEGILAGLFEKAANFDLSDLKTMGTNLSISKALQTLGFADIPSFLGTKAITSGIDYFKNKKVQKEIKKQAAATKTRKETRKIQDRLDKQENNINKNAAKNDSKTGASTVNPNSAYGKKKGYTGGHHNPHTSTGWSGSSKSNKSSSNTGTKSGGGGKGGGASHSSSNKGSVSTGAGRNPWGR